MFLNFPYLCSNPHLSNQWIRSQTHKCNSIFFIICHSIFSRIFNSFCWISIKPPIKKYLNMIEGQNSFFEKSGEKFSSGHVLHDVVELLLRLECVRQADQKRVTQVGHDETLRTNVFDLFVVLAQKTFVNHLKNKSR